MVFRQTSLIWSCRVVGSAEFAIFERSSMISRCSGCSPLPLPSPQANTALIGILTAVRRVGSGNSRFHAKIRSKMQSYSYQRLLHSLTWTFRLTGCLWNLIDRRSRLRLYARYFSRLIGSLCVRFVCSRYRRTRQHGRCLRRGFVDAQD